MAGVTFTETTETQLDNCLYHFTDWYKHLVEENPEVEILWHTKKD